MIIIMVIIKWARIEMTQLQAELSDHVLVWTGVEKHREIGGRKD
jgi:hypothetical protein